MRGIAKDSPQDLFIPGDTGDFEKFGTAVQKTEQELCRDSDLRRTVSDLRPVSLGFPLPIFSEKSSDTELPCRTPVSQSPLT